MGELTARILITDGLLSNAINVLDENFIDNDLDEGDRIMVADEDVDAACAFLEDASISYELV